MSLARPTQSSQLGSWPSQTTLKNVVESVPRRLPFGPKLSATDSESKQLGNSNGSSTTSNNNGSNNSKYNSKCIENV